MGQFSRFATRWLRRYWKSVVCAAAIEAITLSAVLVNTGSVALAGDSLPSGGSTWAGNGDCWQAQTPVMCRNTWNGKGSAIYMRLIDQLSDTPFTTMPIPHAPIGTMPLVRNTAASALAPVTHGPI